MGWVNCSADAVAVGNDFIIKCFINDVVDPAINSLQSRIDKERVQEESDPSIIFLVSELNELRREMQIGFCLSLQALWERQFRHYLKVCIRTLPDGGRVVGDERRAEWEKWPVLEKIFSDLRGVNLSYFNTYSDLMLLNLLGDACRHGNGRAVVKLSREFSELWPSYCFTSDGEFWGGIDEIEISAGVINRLACAVLMFWDDIDYIYLNHLNPRAPVVDRKIELMRCAERRKYDNL